MRNGRVESLDMFEIAAGWNGTQLVIRLSGELDLCSASQVWQALDEAAVRTPTRVLLDLERLTFIDAVGIRAILRGAEIFGSRFILVRTPPRVMRVLTLAGVDERLTFGADSTDG